MTRPDIHRSVLDSLLDGVLVVAEGRIESVNPAAERILGLEPGEARARSFADLFVARDGYDAFTELILDATLPGARPERRVVEVRGRDGPRSISVATSYVRAEAGSDPVAAVAVFSDITELRELRETELRLARAAEEQHAQLQTAYRDIEDRNEALAAALRKVRVAQLSGFALVASVFLGAGLYAWGPGDLGVGAAALDPDVAAAGADRPALRTLTVVPTGNSTTITLRGRLVPWRETAVESPVDATVLAVRFAMGERVAEGQVLVDLDLSRLERTYQSRQLAFLQAEDELRVLENWENESEFVKARRVFTKAQMEMDGRRTQMGRSRFLHEQGLISDSEFADAERQYQNQLLDFETAGEEFEVVRAQADEQAVAGARLARDAAQAAMREAEQTLSENQVRAPFAGTVLPPPRERFLAEGVALRRGEVLFRIGDFSRIAARATADEIDVIKLKAGQTVTATGNAFPGLELPGVVGEVSAEADPTRRNEAVFNVSFLLDRLDDEVHAQVRSGMSAKLEVVSYDNPDALMVPIAAVARRGGRHWLRVLDGDGEPRDREVTVGPTTLREVEIAAGLAAGETVVLDR